MAESDIPSLLTELDTGDMVGFTRRFVDDLETAMASDVGIEADTDWSGVICLGTVSYTHLTLPTIYSV